MRRVLLAVLAMLTLPLAAAPARPAASAPARLALADLKDGKGLSAPIDLAAFAPPPGAKAATGRSAFRLKLDVRSATLTWKLTRDTGASDLGDRGSLPPFDFAFVQDAGAIIPVQRSVIPSSHPGWDWVLEPGKVWTEPGEASWLRAGLPFALKEHNADCVQNGVITFAFKPNSEITKAAIEVASETCRSRKFDLSGYAPATLIPGGISNAAAVAADYHHEVAARLPVRPISDLAKLTPGVDPSKLSLAPTPDGDPPSQYGLVVNGVRYASACATRHGDYPYCEVLDVPSYSTAKSVVGGVGLMRLEKLYPGAAHEMIKDHVPACATGATWNGVTLMNALDMATGVYNTDAYEADEDRDMGGFFRAESHADKIAYTCTHFARHIDPEKTWVYHTADSYTLGAALNDIDKRHGGKNYYDDVIVPLWRQLGLSPAILDSRRTIDTDRQAWTAFGLTYHADDIVRIAGWLGSGAKLNGKPALDQTILDLALQRNPNDTGLQAGSAIFHYKAGFWARNMQPLLGCKQPLWVPFMSGFGGISVVILPGGMVYYYYGDGNIFDWAPAAIEANKIKPVC